MSRAGSAPAADDAAWPDDAVEVGRVVGAWRVRGQIRVAPFSAEPDALLATGRWFLRPAGSSRMQRHPHSGPTPTLLHVTLARRHGDAVIASARELTDRDAAESIKGARVYVARSTSPVAGEGEWIEPKVERAVVP